MISPAAAVLVIDLQTGMFDGVAVQPIYDADALVDRVRQVIAWARRTGRRVAFIRHDAATGEALAPGAPGWPVLRALGQAGDEPTFGKSVGDAFSNADIVKWIAQLGAPEVVIVGAQSDHCVTATLHGAKACGLDVTVAADAHSTWGAGDETAAQIIQRCNAAFAAAGASVWPTAVIIGN